MGSLPELCLFLLSYQHIECQMSTDPPVIAVGMVNYGPTRRKDSAQNIRDTKEFTVNIISEPWIEQANACSVDCPPEISEWDISGLTKEPSVRCSAKLIHAVPVPNIS